jgi:Rad3-related DNA helicase
MKRLDIDPAQTVHVDVPSTFPVQNRPVFYWPIVKINRNSNGADYGALAAAIQHVANTGILKERKGLVHTASYKVVNELMRSRLMYDSRYLFHTEPRQKEVMIELLKTADWPVIVVSPSLGTGVDIKEIGWQVIAKVPFGDLGDSITKLRKEYQRADDPKFGARNYDAEAMNTVVQAAGRAVRSPEDIGVTYILDGNWWGLYKRTYSPKFFAEAVRWI